jgi:uncharacterized membrane protein YdjX (TVP38/TMEM64 family)
MRDQARAATHEQQQSLIWVSAAAILVPLLLLMLGRLYFADQLTLFFDATLGHAHREHLMLPAAIAVFTVAAYLGVPQVVLISASVVALGPQQGFWYSWLATVASGAATYATGRFAREHGVLRMESVLGQRCMRYIAGNVFVASFLVRFCIGLPFLVVNAAFGAARANFIGFVAGLALGALPKTALVVFAGNGVVKAFEGQIGSAVLFGVVAAALWFAGRAVCDRANRA